MLSFSQIKALFNETFFENNEIMLSIYIISNVFSIGSIKISKLLLSFTLVSCEKRTFHLGCCLAAMFWFSLRRTKLTAERRYEVWSIFKIWKFKIIQKVKWRELMIHKVLYFIVVNVHRLFVFTYAKKRCHWTVKCEPKP